MGKIYLFNTYQEEGPENIKATNYWPNVWKVLGSYGTDRRTVDYETGFLRGICACCWKDDGLPVGSWNLSDGWGGIQFHVIELDDPKEESKDE